ncbi:MAG: glycosyltransferase family 4 protein [Acidaminococcaceae bacterium]|nr:glycosyltransferase family 4 protein [Acidaminococcaceae bacterium]
MRIFHIVPEFDEGGVERYVLQLAAEQIAHGHQVSLVTAGGKLEPKLPPEVEVLHLPVQRKNLFTGLYCVYCLAQKRGQWDILHAHSRVPAWIAWWTSALVKMPWIMTAHSIYSLNAGITPFKHANGVICISEPVKQHLINYLPAQTIIVPNGVRKPSRLWEGINHSNQPRFLFVGRLTRLKGLDTVLRALAQLQDHPWALDVIGDGPQRAEWETLTAELNLKERVAFHGFRDDVEDWMIRSSCLLFPSRHEGMGLVVLEALNIGLPVLASDLEPLHPLTSGPLVSPGDVEAWRKGIEKVLEGKGASPLSAEGLPTFEETARKTEEFYRVILSNVSETAH